MDENPRQREQRETRNLVVRFNAIAFGLPALALVLVLTYVFFFDVPLERKDWSNIVFILWIGGLAGLGWALFRALRGRPPSGSAVGTSTASRRSIADWETRSSRRIAWDFVAYVVLIPALALGFVWLANRYIPLEMRHSDWKNAVMVVWCGTLLALVIPTRRAIRMKVGRH